MRDAQQLDSGRRKAIEVQATVHLSGYVHKMVSWERETCLYDRKVANYWWVEDFGDIQARAVVVVKVSPRFF